MAFFTYILKCSDGSYYVGQTDDLERRFSEHQAGEGCKYTVPRTPVVLEWSQEFQSRDEAMAAEQQIKKWNRAKKEALIAGRFNLLSILSSRGREGRALRDALLRNAPQGRG